MSAYLGALGVLALFGLVGIRFLASGSKAQVTEEQPISLEGPAENGLSEVVKGHSDGLSAAAFALKQTTEKQREDVNEQALTLKAVHEVLHSLTGSVDELAELSQRVFNNAESSQHNAETVARAVHTLSTRTGAMTERIASLKELGNRADLLALNAALEGAKAGPEGRRFSVIAARMERMSVQIVEAARSLDTDSQEVASAAMEGVAASEQSLGLAKDSTFAARRFNAVLEQQKLGTTEALTSVQKASGRSEDTLSAVHQVTAAAERVNELAEELNRSLLLLEH